MKSKTNKFWLKNEKKVMEQLGFKQVPGSGNGWIHKEDGENDYALCQLKTTEQQSYKLNLVDVKKLINNANMSNKLPVFVIEFLKNETLVCLRQEDLIEFLQLYMGEKEVTSTVNINNSYDSINVNKQIIKSTFTVEENNEEQLNEIDEIFKIKQDNKNKNKRKW